MFEEVDRIASEYLRAGNGSACQACRTLDEERARATAAGDPARADLLARAAAMICATKPPSPCS